MKKYTLVILLMGLVLGLIAFVLMFGRFFSADKHPIVNVPLGHTWTEYKNKKLGFVIAYPSDIVHPIEVNEPPSPNGFTGADIVWFQDGAKYPENLMFMWINQTKAADALSWFSLLYGPDGKGYKIATTTTMGGVSAVRVDEAMQSIAYNEYNLHFVHSGSVWNFYVQDWRFSQQEIDYMRLSFRFLTWFERI